MLDLILLLALALAGFKGWRSGFLSMLLGLVVLIAAGYIASQFATPFGTAIGVGNSYLRPIVGFIIIFVLIIVLGSQVRKIFRPRRGLLRGLDGLLGAAIGVIRGAFLLSIVLVILRLLDVPSESVRENSVLYPVLLKTSTSVINVLRPYARLPEHDTTV